MGCQSPAASASWLACSQRSHHLFELGSWECGHQCPSVSVVVDDRQGVGRAVLHRGLDGLARGRRRARRPSTMTLRSLGDLEDARAPRTRRRRGPGTGRGRRRCGTAISRPRRTPSGAPVPHPAGLGELHDHLGVVVAVGLGRLGQPRSSQSRSSTREDRLELHHGEGRAHAAVAAGAEGDPVPRVVDVVVARRRGSGTGRSASGSANACGIAVGHRRARRRPACRPGSCSPRPRTGVLATPQQEDERRVQAQRLLDGRLEPRDLAQGLVGDLAAARRRARRSRPPPSAITSGLRSSSMSVHAAVPEVVWCPANIIEMNMPVMMSALNCSDAVVVLDRHEHVDQVAVVLLRRRPSARRVAMIACDAARPARPGPRRDGGSSRCRRRGRRRRWRRCPARGRGRAGRRGRRAPRGSLGPIRHDVEV